MKVGSARANLCLTATLLHTLSSGWLIVVSLSQSFPNSARVKVAHCAFECEDGCLSTDMVRLGSWSAHTTSALFVPKVNLHRLEWSLVVRTHQRATERREMCLVLHPSWERWNTKYTEFGLFLFLRNTSRVFYLKWEQHRQIELKATVNIHTDVWVHGSQIQTHR